jgi:hypothetical protein
VSHDYAAEHVHLAYASTVHGIQGETTDASIVGPGVDAAGLYVGMTRGRAHNEVIAIAHTDRAATERIAESMLRGIPEVSLDDAIRAARTELGRAARTPAPEADKPAPWTDRTRRPLGHELDIDRLATAREEQDRELRQHLGDTRQWLTDTRSALLELDARIAAGDATRHARTPHSGDTLAASRSQLVDEYEARSAGYIQLTDMYRKHAHLLELTETERGLRQTLGEDARRAENAARRSAAASPVAGQMPSHGGLTR